MTASDYRIRVAAAWRFGCIERADADLQETRDWFVPAQRPPSL